MVNTEDGVVLRSSASTMTFTLFMIFGLLRLNDYSVVYYEVDVAVVISVHIFSMWMDMQ